MVQEISKLEQVRAELEAVLASPAFGNSGKYGTLLKYLVDKGLAGETPHEIDIAVDVFEKDESYDPTESSSVRVYIHQLRKKLDDYYAENPSRSNLRLKIPKGSYRVTLGRRDLISLSSEADPPKQYAARLAIAAIVLLSISLVGNAVLLMRQDQATREFPGASLAWNSLRSSPEPILVALGDLFVISEFGATPEDIRFIRDTQINSEADLRAVAGEEFGKSLLPAPLTYLSNASALGLAQVLPALLSLDKPVTFKIMSDVTAEDLRENHVVYIGLFRTMGGLRDYFFEASRFASEPPFVKLRDEKTGQIYQRLPGREDQSKDYGFFANITGPGGRSIIVFAGISEMGVSSAIRALTDPTSAKILEEQLTSSFANLPDSVEILFEVAGYDRVDLNTRIAVAGLPN